MGESTLKTTNSNQNKPKTASSKQIIHTRPVNDIGREKIVKMLTNDVVDGWKLTKTDKRDVRIFTKDNFRIGVTPNGSLVLMSNMIPQEGN